MQRPLRIAVVTQYFWPIEGGASVMLRRLAEAWSDQGHRVDVLTTRCSADLPVRESIGAVAIRRLPSAETRLVGTAQYAARTFAWVSARRHELDVVLVSMLKHAAVACLAAGRLARLPVVLRTEGGGQTGDMAWQEQARFGRWIRRRCLHAAAFVAISDAIHQELIAAGYSSERIHAVPNAVAVPDRPWSPEEAVRLRANLGLPEHPTLCFTGRLRPLKGVADLLHALPIVEASLGPCQLVIAGDGPERANLGRLAARLGLEGRVHFAGHVRDVTDYLRASDLYVLPSYVEGMSVALLEALALGLPALASDIDANRHLLPDALLPLFPVRDPAALAERIKQRLVVRDPSRLDEQRRQVGQKYGIEAVARRYAELFRQLVR